ncbi:MAG: chromate transporter [Candidatus Eremiobacteraeota bacterium]|nr:chromate transporter [Candidatus Eremiobacteraeota bacterium]MBV8499356.1 chromate transporter [Candidatus Eremiobacteraeota bacterium]
MSGFADNLLHLLWTFAQLSVLGFGGGKGIIPQMHYDAVTRYQWVTSQQFTQFYTIGKLVPGPTTIFAALVGYAAIPGRPLLGATVATIAMFVPSSAIMVAFDALWVRFQASPWRVIIAQGLAPAIVGLVWSSVWTIARGVAVSWVAYAVAAVVTVLMLRTKLSTPVLILLSGVVGVAALR